MRCHLLLLPVFVLTVACSDSTSRSSGAFDERSQPPVSNPGGSVPPAANEIAATPPASTPAGTSGQGGPGGGGNPVPEPGTLLLLGTGLAGASLLRRKKREAA